MSETRTGSCLCGAVGYRVVGPLRPIVACHCNQCRKASGHFVAATQCRSEDLTLTGESPTWFRSSETAERGFCGRCGSNLFWRRFGNAHVSIWAGSIDGASGLRLEAQIHTGSKGDYYDLPDVPEIAQDDLQ